MVPVLAVALALAAATPGFEVPAGPASPSASACPQSLKFAGQLFLDTDQTVPAGEVGPVVGVTEPNPARCGVNEGLDVRRHAGHLSTQQVLLARPDGSFELFQSAGVADFPGAGLLRLLVVLLVAFVLLFAALPALIAHLRRPPIQPTGAGDEPGQ